MKKLSIHFALISIILLFISLNPHSAFAQNLTTSASIRTQLINLYNNLDIQNDSFNTISTISDNESVSTLRSLKTINDFQSYGISEIDRRIKSLTELQSSVDMYPKLSTDEKNYWKKYIQDGNHASTGWGTINAMEKLKNSILKDSKKSDLNALQKDIDSIVKDNRVYYQFIPSVNLLIEVDITTSNLEHQSDLARSLQAYLDQAQKDNKDISKIQPLQDDLGKNLNNAGTILQYSADEIFNMNPASYPSGNHYKKYAQEYIDNARSTLGNSASDIRIILQELIDLYQ